MPTLSAFDESQGIAANGAPKDLNSLGVMRKSKQFSNETPKKFSFMAESIARNVELLASSIENPAKNQNFIRNSQYNQGEVPVFSENKIPSELYYFDMDTVGITSAFYPHNNVENVLKTVVNKIRKKSKRKTLKPIKN